MPRLPPAILHAPLLRNHYLLNRHSKAGCGITADGGYCVNCELVGAGAGGCWVLGPCKLGACGLGTCLLAAQAWANGGTAAHSWAA